MIEFSSIRMCATLFCFMCLGGDAVQAQTSPLTISLRLLTGNTVEVVEKNNTSDTLRFPCNGPGMQFVVRRADGTLASDTAAGLRMKSGAALDKFSSSKVCVSDSLKGGGSVTFTFDLSLLYKVSDPGQYTVTVEQNAEGIPAAKSNVVTFMKK